MKKFLLASVLSILLVALSCQMVYAEHDDVGGYDALKFRSSKEPTLPVDPTNPEIPVDPMNPDGSRPEPGTGDALSIDFASSLDFGMNKISNKDEYYAAQAQRYFNDPRLITPNFGWLDVKGKRNPSILCRRDYTIQRINRGNLVFPKTQASK